MKTITKLSAAALLIATSIVVDTSTFAAEILGNPIKPATVDGRLKFGVQIVHDTDVGLSITSAFIGREIAPNDFTSLAVRLYDSKLGKYVSPWLDYKRLNKPVVLPGYFAMSVRFREQIVVDSVVNNLKNITLVMAVNQPSSAPIPTHHLGFNQICDSNPQNFLDLTTGQAGCN